LNINFTEKRPLQVQRQQIQRIQQLLQQQLVAAGAAEFAVFAAERFA
jgi:hypothetical protein